MSNKLSIGVSIIVALSMAVGGVASVFAQTSTPTAGSDSMPPPANGRSLVITGSGCFAVEH